MSYHCMPAAHAPSFATCRNPGPSPYKSDDFYIAHNPQQKSGTGHAVMVADLPAHPLRTDSHRSDSFPLDHLSTLSPYQCECHRACTYKSSKQPNRNYFVPPTDLGNATRCHYIYTPYTNVPVQQATHLPDADTTLAKSYEYGDIIGLVGSSFSVANNESGYIGGSKPKVYSYARASEVMPYT